MFLFQAKLEHYWLCIRVETGPSKYTVEICPIIYSLFFVPPSEVATDSLVLARPLLEPGKKEAWFMYVAGSPPQPWSG